MEPRRLLSTSALYPTLAGAEFPIPSGGSGLNEITVGPDGNLWFAEDLVGKIGSIDPTTHAFTEPSLPAGGSEVANITAGPDGNLWFTDPRASKVGMINPTTHAIAEFPTPTANSGPSSIAAGSDGNLWFTEGHAQVGVINPSTHAITELTIPAGFIAAGPDGRLWFTDPGGSTIGSIDPATLAIVETRVPADVAALSAITVGPDRNFWFTEFDDNKIGTINPTTRAINEFTLPTASSEPTAITAGSDGNLWFTESFTGKIGMISPVTHVITEFNPSTAQISGPTGIAAGPDGNVWFTQPYFQEIGLVTPPMVLSVTAGPPALVTPGGAFGLTVTVFLPSGQVYTAFDGDVTLALADPGGARLDGTLIAAAHDGVASFTGLSIDRAGTYRILATAGPTTTLSPPVTAAVAPAAVAAVPPTVVAENVRFAGKGRRRRVVGYELDFSTAMDPARAASPANYTLTQFQRRGRRLVAQPVGVRAAYDATAHSVILTLAGRPKFAAGGRLVVVARPPTGLTNATGAPLDGGNQGTFGDDGTFVIAPKGTAISR